MKKNDQPGEVPYQEVHRCPQCGERTEYKREDLGGVDYWYHHWRACTNPHCSWQSEKVPEEFETGPYHS